MILDAIAVPGPEVAANLDRLLSIPGIVEVHLHFAGPGCFAARAKRD